MLQILALILGFCSWVLMAVTVVRQKRLTTERVCVLYAISWIFCAVALYIPTLCQFLEFAANDYSAVIDCTATYHLASAVLITSTAVLNIISIILYTMRHHTK